LTSCKGRKSLTRGTGPVWQKWIVCSIILLSRWDSAAFPGRDFPRKLSKLWNVSPLMRPDQKINKKRYSRHHGLDQIQGPCMTVCHSHCVVVTLRSWDEDCVFLQGRLEVNPGDFSSNSSGNLHLTTKICGCDRSTQSCDEKKFILFSFFFWHKTQLNLSQLIYEPDLLCNLKQIGMDVGLTPGQASRFSMHSCWLNKLTPGAVRKPRTQVLQPCRQNDYGFAQKSCTGMETV
jgi:hypothetical protein